MRFFAEFFTLAMTAIFLENVVFSRALGASRMLNILKQGKNLLGFGALLTVMTTLASAATYFINGLLKETELKFYYRPFFFVLAITIIYIGIYLGMKQFLPALHTKLGATLTFATFNCALLGSVFLSADQNFNLAKTLGFGFGSGLGFTIATLLVYEGKRRLTLSEVPKSFRGFPITLMYLGMVALAMYGLVGHQLPF
ncbi:Rnf-Nqr domain containing protein [Hydrogenoanaerobacterium sp.]|uniref:Rnf-Nqr domain containing protein n=1 Tax=Hydrogenoanaerobacterium sp. TaxID=2953763 RepID=UPI0028A202EB|nr:Rnf-Nqr domain containing protein [Hydrogenoanaerobacterium sp.]